MEESICKPFEQMEEAVMAKALEIEVKAKMTVDRATAEACLKMVELYVNSNGVNVMVDKLESGELKFYYEPIDASDGRCGNA